MGESARDAHHRSDRVLRRRGEELASVSVHVPSDNYGIIEDAHQACMHLLAQYVRQSRMSPDDVTANTF